MSVLGLVVFLAAEAFAQGADNTPPPRVSFEISTGSTTGTYFPVGQRIAQLVSHPPGVGRCEAAGVCGPAGLIVSTRASEGSVANVLAVTAGVTNSGLAQADIVALAIAGKGPFAKSGPATSLRVVADLYGEDVHLIAAKNAKITNVDGLRGKRVSISTEGSGTIITARAILSAYQLSEKTIVPNYDAADKATELLIAGKLDAIFFVGGTPVNLISQLVEQGIATLVPIGGAGRERLLARAPYLSAHAIPEGTYHAAPAIETVSVDALWITDASQPNGLIYAMTKALFHPANRSVLEMDKLGTHFFELASAAGVSMPFHTGALQFYLESRVVKPAEKVSLPPPPLPKRS